MEKLNLKESNETNPTIKDDNPSNQLESPITEYDSAESQSDPDQKEHDESNTGLKTVQNGTLCSSNLISHSRSEQSNELNSIANLSIKDEKTSINKLRANSLKETEKSLNGFIRATNDRVKSNQVQGRKSDNEILVAQTKERITQKFDLLEKQTGVKLKKSGLNFSNSNSQETLSSNNYSLRTNENDHSSPDEVDYAHSHGSESVSSFEIKNQTMSAEKVKEKAAIRLEAELQKAQKELKLRDEEIAKLSRIRREVEIELEDLTASLFEEANRMVQEAKHAKSKSDKRLQEVTMKNDVLLAEVNALKTLVRNTIPNSTTISNTNRQGSFKSIKSTSNSSAASNNSLDLIKNQFTPKLIKSPKNSIRAIINRTSIPFHSRTSKTTISKLMKSEKRSCKKSPSNYELASEMSRYLNDSQQPTNDTLEKVKEETNQCINDLKKFGEIDPLYYEEFLEWKAHPVLNKEGKFMRRIYEEEIETTMNFKNRILTDQVLEAIKQNNIIIELNTDKSNFQKKCALLDIPRICNHRMKINDEWYNISQLCRDRTSAVCDLFCYLRYIQQGLVKSALPEVYWEIIRRRRNVILSKLGFSAL